MNKYLRNLSVTLAAIITIVFAVGHAFPLFISYASVTDEAMTHSSLYYELEAEAAAAIDKLEAFPSGSSDEDTVKIREFCLNAYQDFSEIFDKADASYENGDIDNTEYASIIEMLNDYGEKLNIQFERLGFDPYAAEPAYAITLTSSRISNFVNDYQWNSSYNGSNIIINFSFDIKTTNDKLHRIYVGSGAELLKVDAYGYNHATTDPSKGAKYFTSSYGTVTLTSINMGTYRTIASGYITITNASGFSSWYNSNSRALSFTTYSDSGTDYEYYPDGSTGMNPTNISNITTAINQGTCSHSYSCTAVNASTHKTACTKCGYVKETSAHNSSVTDTSSSPGYTLKKCSACGYTVSSTANSYSVTIDMGTGNTSDNLKVTATYNAAMPNITVPSRLGYVFMGCFTQANGAGVQYYLDTGKSARTYNLTSGTTLYAYWKRSCSITSLSEINNEFACTGN